MGLEVEDAGLDWVVASVERVGEMSWKSGEADDWVVIGLVELRSMATMPDE